MRDRVRVITDCSGDGRTKQSFRAQCDVNSIVERARKTGMVTHLNAKSPLYMDASAVPDYQAALNIVNLANEKFSSLSSKVRERFANDPAKMVEFLSDKSNYDDAVKLGLVVKKEVPKAPPVHRVHVVNPVVDDDKPSSKKKA